MTLTRCPIHGDLAPGAARCAVAGCDVPPLDLRQAYGGCQAWHWREDVPRERTFAPTPTTPTSTEPL